MRTLNQDHHAATAYFPALQLRMELHLVDDRELSQLPTINRPHHLLDVLDLVVADADATDLGPHGRIALGSGANSSSLH